MGFSTCVRVVSRTVQRGVWFFLEQSTELVALRPGADEESDLIHVPVHYRAPLRPGTDSLPASAVRPVATVLAGVCAFLADSACVQDAAPPASVPRTGLGFSFANLEEWADEPEPALPATRESRYAFSSVFAVPAKYAQLPTVVGSVPGWVVGHLDVAGSSGGLPAGVVVLPDALPGPAGSSRPMGRAGGPWCPPGRLCEAIVPGTPGMHVRGVFTPAEGEGVAEVREAHRLGAHTLSLLRAADVLAYGTPVPENPKPLFWWLLPVVLLLRVFYCTAFAILGPFDKAVQIAREFHWNVVYRKLWAGLRHLFLGIPHAIRKRSAERARHRRGSGRAGGRAKLASLGDKALEVVGRCAGGGADGTSGLRDPWAEECRAALGRVRQWLGRVAEWEKSKDNLAQKVDIGTRSLAECAADGAGRGEGSGAEVIGCVCRVRRAPSGEKESWQQFRRIRGCLAKIDENRIPLDKVDRATSRAWNLANEGRRLAKRIRGVARRARRISKSERRLAGKAGGTPAAAPGAGQDLVRAAEVLERILRALPKTATALERDSDSLRKRAQVLSLQEKRRLLEMERRRSDAVVLVVRYREADFRLQRKGTEDYIGRSIRDTGRVLARFGTLSWIRLEPRILFLLVATGVVLATHRLASPLAPDWRFLVVLAVAALAATILLGRGGRAERASPGGPLSVGRDAKELGRRSVFLCGIAMVAAVGHGFALRIDEPVLNDMFGLGVHEDLWALVYLGVTAVVFLASALRAEQHRPMRLTLLYRLASNARSRKRAIKRVLSRVPRNVCGAAGAHALLLALVFVVSIGGLHEGGPHEALGQSRAPNAALGDLIRLGFLGAFLLPALVALMNLPRRGPTPPLPPGANGSQQAIPDDHGGSP